MTKYDFYLCPPINLKRYRLPYSTLNVDKIDLLCGILGCQPFSFIRPDKYGIVPCSEPSGSTVAFFLFSQKPCYLALMEWTCISSMLSYKFTACAKIGIFHFSFSIRSLVPLLFTPPSPLIPIYHQPSRIENVLLLVS